MWILPFVGYAGVLFGFAFLTLAIASGLYYLSELVEEHTVPAKKFLTRLIYAIILTQTLLLIDRFPLWRSLLGIGSHVVYLQNLRRFPLVQLSDPFFIVSCVLVLFNHYVWFTYFSNPSSAAHQPSRSLYASGPDFPTFTEIASYFGICIWLVPFALFVSLSASENVLPSSEFDSPFSPSNPSFQAESSPSRLPSGGISGMTLTPMRATFGALGSGSRSPSQIREGSLGHGGDRRGRRKGAKGMVRVAVDGVREWVGETGEVMGLWKGERTRRF